MSDEYEYVRAVKFSATIIKRAVTLPFGEQPFLYVTKPDDSRRMIGLARSLDDARLLLSALDHLMIHIERDALNKKLTATGEWP